MTTYYPIAVDLSKKKVLVVGGGKVALRKIETLLEYGADVTVVSPEIEPEIDKLVSDGRVKLKKRPYYFVDLKGIALVIAATDDETVNAKVSSDAADINVLVNVVDVPDLCDFIVPATVKRGDLVIGIWTGGKSPMLSKQIRKQLEEQFGGEYEQYLEILGEARELAKAKYPSQKDREQVLRKLLETDVLEMLRDGKIVEAREKALSCI